MFLQAVDTVLAFAMVMLLLSLLVTVLVQMFISLFGLRGQNLVFGLRQLVGAVAPKLDEAEVESLASKILGHPALRAGARRATVDLEPRELLMVMDRLRKGEVLAPRVKAALDELFQRPASEDAKLVRTMELLGSLRAAAPEQAEKLQKLADGALAEAREVVVQIDNWFDTAMSHAAERLKLHARWITAAVALSLAVLLQVDSAEILKQLWHDPGESAQLVVQADEVMKLYRESATVEEFEQGREAAQQIRALLGESELVVFAALGESGDPRAVFGPHFPGSLLTALLLSLGAPFWYGVVGKLVGFRSALRGKQPQAAKS